MSTEKIEDIYPLSPMQQGILFHSLYDPDSGMYVVQVVYDLLGKLDVPVFDRAWQRVVERHSILRTSFVWEDLAEPVQVVHRHVRVPLEYQDWRGLSPAEQQAQLESDLKVDRARGFELSDASLMRLGLIQVAEEEHRLVWSLHHLLLDGWSKSILLNEVLAFYEAFRLDQDLRLEPSASFRDYIAWLRQQDLSTAEAFWRSTLKGFIAPTPLGVEKTSIFLSQDEEAYGHEEIKLSVAASTALQSFARLHKLTLSTLAQGAWALLLSRYSGENDVVFGSVVSGRPAALAGVESMTGLFVNTLPMRVKTSPEETLLTWLKQLQEQQIEMLQYEYSPLIRIQEWSDVPRSLPLFETILEFSSYPRDGLVRQKNGTVEIHRSRSVERTNYPLTVVVVPGSELSIGIWYQGTRFDRATIIRMLAHFRNVLEGMVTDSEQRLGELPLLSAEERHQLLVQWNDTAREYPNKCVHQLFEAQVERTPDHVAVLFGNEQLTYGELNRRANQLARYLRRRGIGPDALVSVCMERSVEMVVGILAVLKSGGAYVPLDPAYPQERLAFMLDDTRSPILLTQQHLLERLPDTTAEIVRLEADWNEIAVESYENVVNEATTENLAYVIYTSGSTGRPKGVAMTHGPLSNLLSWQLQSWTHPDATTTLQFASTSFDVSFQEIFSTWCSGGTLVLIPEVVRRDAEALSHFLAEKAIERLFLPFVALQQLAEAVNVCGLVPTSLREVITAGEQLRITPQIASLFSKLQHCTLCNQYGPSESHVVTAFTLMSSPGKWAVLPPIGRPIANTQIYILDKQLEPVPIGVAGELYIGGDGVARGYLKRPELTAERFISDRFSAEGGRRLYRTGDLARYLADGNIEFLGRIDQQVKIRGYRIELGEIEAVLSGAEGVEEVAVIAREDVVGDKRLVAYVVPQQETGASVSGLRSFLHEQLPEYMVPSAFVMLEELPLTPNGKVDRRALPAPEQLRPELECSYMAPRTAAEEVVAGVWAEVLGVELVGVNDDFFELGGHSLLATQVISRLQEAFQVRIPLRRLFDMPTVAKLAESIETPSLSNERIESSPILTVSRDGQLPLSFAQQRLWFIDQLNPDTSFFNIPDALRLDGLLDVETLKESLNEIVRRHESLRTTFDSEAGNPVQVIAPTLELKLPVIDLSEIPEAQREAEAQLWIREEVACPFDLAQGPLLRTSLLRLGPEKHVLLLTMHHIITDGWSMSVFVRELTRLYEAFSTNQPSPLPELSIQYADYAVWQREWMRGETLERQLAYWKKQLAGAPAILKLPTDRPRPAEQTLCGENEFLIFPQRLSDSLRALGRREGATLFMTLLAAFQTLLARYTGQEDIVVGTDVANRNRVGIEGLIGFFVNHMVLRTDLSGDPTFSDLLKRVREVALGASAHQDLPFDKLVEALKPRRSLSHTPLFQVLFSLQNEPKLTQELQGLSFTPMRVHGGMARYDLTLFIDETEQGLVGRFNYNKDLFDAGTIKKMVRDFQTLLETVVERPESRLSILKMDSEAEKRHMMETKEQEPSFKKFKNIKPRTINVPQAQLVKTEYLRLGETLPLVMRPGMDDVNLPEWAKSNQEFIELELTKHGAILFRGFKTGSVSEFEKFATGICQDLFNENGEHPRDVISNNVYTPVFYPQDKKILWHNENSFNHRWPAKIWFCCVQPAKQGGETPIVDSRKVYELIDPKIKERFMRRGVMYVRNYGDGLGLSWQTVFRTSDRSVVEEQCRKALMNFEWKNGDGLRTSCVRAAAVKHPKTGELVWFNQAQHWHVSCLEPEVRESLLAIFPEADLPRNCYYGDGSPIEDSVMKEILDVYQKLEISFRWEKNDILMLDNMLTAHARNPFVGERKLLVAMGEMTLNGNK